MITLAISSLVLGLIATAVALVVVRLWFPSLTMKDVLWPLRLPAWVAWVGMPLSLIGMLLWVIGLAVKSPGLIRWGGGITAWGLGGFVGGWLAGIGTSYVLQFVTGWLPAPIIIEPKK